MPLTLQQQELDSNLCAKLTGEVSVLGISVLQESHLAASDDRRYSRVAFLYVP